MNVAARSSLTQHSTFTGSSRQGSGERNCTSCRTTTTPSASSSLPRAGAWAASMSMRASWR